jgi:hypothetical protein
VAGQVIEQLQIDAFGVDFADPVRSFADMIG